MKYKYFVSFRWYKEGESGFATFVADLNDKIDSEEKIKLLANEVSEQRKYQQIIILGLTLLDTRED